MQKNERIVRYTSEELRQMRERGEDLTNWARVDAMTEEELEASIDIEEEGMPIWDSVIVGFPQPKQQLTVRFDRDIIEWFRDQGPGYQTRMNAVLRSYVDAKKRAALRVKKEPKDHEQ